MLTKGEQLLLDLGRMTTAEAQSLAPEQLQAEAYMRRLEDALDVYHRPAAAVDARLAVMAEVES